MIQKIIMLKIRVRINCGQKTLPTLLHPPEPFESDQTSDLLWIILRRNPTAGSRLPPLFRITKSHILTAPQNYCTRRLPRLVGHYSRTPRHLPAGSPKSSTVATDHEVPASLQVPNINPNLLGCRFTIVTSGLHISRSTKQARVFRARLAHMP